MTKTWLAMLTALTLISGVAVAQTTETTTTTETTGAIPVPVPVAPPAVVQSTNERTVDANGVVTDRTRTVTSGAMLSPYGGTVTTRKTTDTTTVH